MKSGKLKTRNIRNTARRSGLPRGKEPAVTKVNLGRVMRAAARRGKEGGA